MWLELIQAPKWFLKNQTEPMRKGQELRKNVKRLATSNVWHVGFATGAIGAEVGKTANLFTWCVRGGYGYDAR